MASTLSSCPVGVTWAGIDGFSASPVPSRCPGFGGTSQPSKSQEPGLSLYMSSGPASDWEQTGLDPAGQGPCGRTRLDWTDWTVLAQLHVGEPPPHQAHD